MDASVKAVKKGERASPGELKCRGGTLLGSDVYLPMPSVGATENALLCACGADGVTTIYLSLIHIYTELRGLRDHGKISGP